MMKWWLRDSAIMSPPSLFRTLAGLCNHQAQAPVAWAPIMPGAAMRLSWVAPCWVANSMDQPGRTAQVFLLGIPLCSLAVLMTPPAIAVNGYPRHRLISMRRRWRIGMGWTQSSIGLWYSPISQNLPRRTWVSSVDKRG